MSGKALSAIKEFQRNNENITSCLKEAIKSNEKHERAENILLELDFLLDTGYWCDSIKITTFYKNSIGECRKRKETDYCRKLQLSQSFGLLQWPTNEADLLLSEESILQQQSETLPAEVTGKWLCYYGFRQISLSKQQEGLLCLEEGAPMLGST